MNSFNEKWRFWLSLIIMVVLVPLAVWLSSRFQLRYYLSGLIIIVLTIAAFFLHFEPEVVVFTMREALVDCKVTLTC